MSINFLPPEMLCEILKNCDFQTKFSFQRTNKNFLEFGRDNERNMTVYFDGSGSSIRNIFFRCESIGKVHLEFRHLELFEQLFGKGTFSLLIHN